MNIHYLFVLLKMNIIYVNQKMNETKIINILAFTLVLTCGKRPILWSNDRSIYHIYMCDNKLII